VLLTRVLPHASLATFASLTVYPSATQHGVFSARVGVPKSKMPTELNPVGILFWRRPTLARPVAVLPSGLQRFTSVFGMGTGGATALGSPECDAALTFRCYRSDACARPNLWGPRAIEVNRHYLNFQRTCWISDIYIQEFISTENSRRYNRASFYFEIFRLFCLPSRKARDGLTEK
jgi:hypothetical protein